MEISAIKFSSNRKINKCFFNSVSVVNKPNTYNYSVGSDTFYKSSSNNFINFPYITISFCGYPVHIVDGGNHATNMQHFAKAVSNDIEIQMYDVEVNQHDANMKQLRSLEMQLKNLNSEHPKFLDNDYIAVPALASVPLLNLQDQYNRIMNDDKVFTSENLKANKRNLLKFLKIIYENPNKYRQYINYMDNNRQGIEYTYGVIREINKAKAHGAKIYIPSGHPQDSTLKWLAAQRGFKPELYNYIATGVDEGNVIQNMSGEIKNNNWYDFNLLSLSEANVVGVKGTTGAQDYMFAAYDSCVTDGARGVYNFSPVRDGDKLVGYSYTDTKTNEYPYEEFPANLEIANLTKFVGKNIDSVVAGKEEIEELKRALKYNNTDSCADKLYPVPAIFSKDEIIAKKINLQGDYVDKTLTLYFRKNKDNKVIFPKCDCEGSGKPSVLSMWGSCFSVFNAIARDINNQNRQYPFIKDGKCAFSDLDTHKKIVEKTLERGIKSGVYKDAEQAFNYAIQLNKAFEASYNLELLDYRPYQLLGDLHFQHKNFDYAASCYNNAINILSKKILEQVNENSISEVRKDYNSYINELALSESYNHQVKVYNSKNIFSKFFAEKPVKPEHYYDYKDLYYDNYVFYNTLIKPCANMYKRLHAICSSKHEFYPAEVCEQAYYDILRCTDRGQDVMKLRSEGVLYIGDLYNEIRREDY